ncbi:hypothetical protein RND71_032024 [Anisodus tanguticus]|uniref:Uncharacterized protein n=1 Tax=Anisodus tanguticus TaxID=243964 RepID=A0AAE1V5E3_9SOLA|nr:hypothetical protein RND71_032024 [Anisodus tanguticus]
MALIVFNRVTSVKTRAVFRNGGWRNLDMSKSTRKSPLVIKEEAVKSPQQDKQLINSVENRKNVNVEQGKSEKGVVSNDDDKEDGKKSLK